MHEAQLNPPAYAAPRMADRARVTITVPGRPEYLRLVRLASADMATRAGFDFEEVDDFRIGVSELCSLLLSGAPAPLELTFTVAPGKVLVDGSTRGGAPREDVLARTIVAAVLDEHEMVVEGDALRFRATKEHRDA
jgi:hypothetical protein